MLFIQTPLCCMVFHPSCRPRSAVSCVRVTCRLGMWGQLEQRALLSFDTEWIVWPNDCYSIVEDLEINVGPSRVLLWASRSKV